MRVFKPTRKNLHPRIIRTMERIKKWHEENGYSDDYSVDDILQKQFVAIKAGAFTILVQDASEKEYHGNASVDVYNSKGVIVDNKVLYNPVKGHRVPKRAFIGTPIVDGSRPMQYKPVRRKDPIFIP
ncbi:MAG: hypothetical protein AAB930_01160 [Patescibacteria group bacterium]